MLTINRRSFIIRHLRELFFICAVPMLKIYWFLFRPYRPGAKTFIFYEDKLLLARLGYGHKSWVLPGGGMERGETHLETAIRETKEEVGITLREPVFIGEQSNTRQFKKITVFYYIAHVCSEDLIIDGQEIKDAAWFTLDSLPPDARDYLKQEIEMLKKWDIKQL